MFVQENPVEPLRLVYFNAQGITSKYTLLRELAYEDKPDIISITETWLSKDIGPLEYQISEYTFFTRHRDLSFYRVGLY